MSERKVRLVLVASGSGTDANAIMAAWRHGEIPDCEIVRLISTKPDVGCLEKAQTHQVETRVIDRKLLGQAKFEEEMARFFAEIRAELIFLVGCINRVPIGDIPIYNIHPADPIEHGGKRMFGLVVHIHVLQALADKIRRGWATVEGPNFTYPTVHQVVSSQYDQGPFFLRATVEIPPEIVKEAIAPGVNEELAEKLQKHVLPYEWLILPTAVNMAIRKILGKEKEK